MSSYLDNSVYMVSTYEGPHRFVEGLFSSKNKAWEFIQSQAEDFFEKAEKYNEVNHVIRCAISSNTFDIVTIDQPHRPSVVYEIQKMYVE